MVNSTKYICSTNKICFAYKKFVLSISNFLGESSKGFNKIIRLAELNGFFAFITTTKFRWNNETFARPTKYFFQCSTPASISG